MPPWFWIVGALGAGGAYLYGQRHGASLADRQGSAYDSGATASSLLDYGISPAGNSSYTGYGGSFVINPSLIADTPGSPPTETKPPTGWGVTGAVNPPTIPDLRFPSVLPGPSPMQFGPPPQ